MYDVEQQLRSALHEAAPAGHGVPFEPIARRAARRRQLATVGGTTGVVLASAGLVAATAVWNGPGTPPVSSGPTKPAPTSAVNSPSACVPNPDSGNVQVDYADFVQFGGRSYLATGVELHPHPTGGWPWPGPQVGTVACTLSETNPGPDHRPEDGDAAFLPRGTKLHAMYDYPTSFRLVAHVGSRYLVYEVHSAPAATRGVDLLPVRGKVARIEILDYETGTRVVGKVTDPARINRVVDGIEKARLDRRQPGGRSLLLRFVLSNGMLKTETRKWAWYEDASKLEDIVLPADVNAILRDAS